MGRKCPVCGKGPYRQKRLKRHIKMHHPDYYHQWIWNGGSNIENEELAAILQAKREAKKKRIEKLDGVVKE